MNTTGEMRYSVIVPAYNEEALLPHTLKSIRKAMQAVPIAGEIIVVDNNSDDATAEVAERLGATVVFEKINQISRARNRGAGRARGDYLVFVDADTLITGSLLSAAISRLNTGRCCGGGAAVAADQPLSPFYQMFLNAWNWYSRRTGSAAGSFIYCLRNAFEEIGGFSQEVYVAEELIFSRRLRRWGRRRKMAFVIIRRFPVVTSSRKLQWLSPVNIGGLLLLAAFFPLAIRFRKMCAMWYRRPV